MDLPLDLSSGVLITGKDELYQDMMLLLKNHLWSFYSDYRLGSSVAIHTDDTFVMSESIKSTLEKMQNVNVLSVVVDGDFNANVKANYNGLFIDFNFSLNELQD